MRSNVLKLGLLLLLLPAGAAAQQFAASQLIVPLPDGGFVSFKNEIQEGVNREFGIFLNPEPVFVGFEEATMDQKGS